MSDVPRLTIQRGEDVPLTRGAYVITLDGTPITDEESTEAAIYLACRRRGWALEWCPERPFASRSGWYVVTEETDYEGDTPAEAYRAATRDEES